MTPEAQRIAIAEACGWTSKTRSNIYEGKYAVWLKNGKLSPTKPPDYLNDLNAMHEAEAALTGSLMDENSQKSEYVERLVFACNGDGEIDIWFWHQIHATAAQRAEAFLRTISKWKD